MGLAGVLFLQQCNCYNLMDFMENVTEYTLFRKFLLNNIDLFFISELDPVFRTETNAKITAGLLALAF